MNRPTMTAAEFQERGYLLEVNRRVLHPLGLALAVTRDNETGEVTLGPVLDARDDPEGYYFGEFTDAEVAKVRALREEWARRSPARALALGSVVEPLPGE